MAPFASAGPFILRKSEFLSSSDSLSYFDICNQRSVDLAGQLGFTYCQVPVVYSLAEETSIALALPTKEKVISGDSIDTETSLAIFDKTGEVVKINVALQTGIRISLQI